MKETVLEVLSKRHSEWLNMAMSFKVSKTDADELVSGMYLKMHDYIKDVDRIMYSENEVNTFYIFKTIQNLFRSKYHITGKTGGMNNDKHSRVDFNSGDWHFLGSDVLDIDARSEFEEYMDSQFTSMKSEINDVVESWYWYDKKLYKLNTEEGMSMRKIAKDTNISLKSVFLTLKGCKSRIKEVFQDRYDVLSKLRQDL